MLGTLFTNAGRRTYLVEFALALQRQGYPVDVHVSDCTPVSATMHLDPEVRSHILPPVLEDPERYLSSLLELVRQERIDVIFPLSDLDPEILAANRERFASLGCRVIVGSPEVVAYCNDKRLTFEFCRQHGLPTPETWFDAETYTGPFPAFQKHILGSGSSGARRVDGPAGLRDFGKGRDMLQPCIEGEEFGLDILNSLQGECLAVCVKRKLLMRAGETDKAQVIRDEALECLGREISAAFRHIGNLDCDVLRARDGQLYCIDFNPRFGGGYPFTHLAGYNYLKAILDMVRNEEPSLPEAPRLITAMKGISLHCYDTP